MKLKHLALALIAAAAATGTAISAANPKPFTVPEVREWKGASGSWNVFDAHAVVYTDKSLATVAAQLADDLRALGIADIKAEAGSRGGKNDITLSIVPDRKNADKEKYSMDISRNGVTITANAVEGARWGAMTLLQLSEEDGTVPCGRADDYPAYGFRGFMIDAGRKYIPLKYLYRLVDVMAYRKMNELHVHLNDNGFPYFFDNDWQKTQAAFRLECETFPGLTARDGSYTKKEFRDFQDYAASRGVEVIPEIDVPAHSLAFTLYKPEIGSNGSNGFDHLDISNPETYRFVDALLAEYLEGPDPVFKGRRFHIGTDEYQGDAEAMEQFRAFTDRYIRLAEKYGKEAAVWGSLSHAKGSTPVKVDSVLMYLWSNDYSRPEEMIALGYDVVSIPDRDVYIVPAAGYYHDYLDTRGLYADWTPADIKGYKLNEGHPQLKGGMFAVWNDHPGNGVTVADIHHRTMAALPVMAAKTWNGPDVTFPYDRFATGADALSEAPGVNLLGRYGLPHSVVLDCEVVYPQRLFPIDQIGYDYTVDFDLECAEEKKGTVLFSSPDATLWLSDPVAGSLAFSREDKLYRFRYAVRPGETNHITIVGTKDGTRLYVDGDLVDNLDRRWIYFPDEPNNRYVKMAEVRTLMFPVQQAGNFQSKITNLRVSNYDTMAE